jgi:outer membrane immunogenic protein
MAADLRAPPPAPLPPPIPLFTWTGFYIGANAGWGERTNRREEFFGFTPSLVTPTPPLGALTPVVIPGGFPATAFPRERERGGFVGGGQIGYNYQFTPGAGWVIGLEADVQWADFERRREEFFGGFGAGPFGNEFTAVPTAFTTGRGIAPPVVGSAGNVVLFDNAFGNRERNRRNNVFGTVRGRIGYAVDRWLVYGTGGLAWTENNRRNENEFFVTGTSIPTPFFISPAAAAAGTAVTPTTFLGNRENNNIGWTAGGGVEYAFTNNITVRVEGLYASLGRERRTPFTTGAVGVTNTGSPVTLSELGFVETRRRNNDFFVVRGGVNYLFNTF